MFLLSDKSLILEELIAAPPLNTDDIAQLFDHSDQYIIPYLQTDVKRYGLVLYNTENREGAESEAKTMNDCLVTAGFHTKMKEWKYSYELFLEISETKISELVTSGLSLLVISIMSHGTAGMLRGRGGTVVPISGILSSLRSRLPDKLPLVSSLKKHQ